MAFIANFIPQSEIEQLKKLLGNSHNIVITCHMSPDGDALGSSLCLCHTLKNMGKNAVVITPDAFPAHLEFLPGTKDIVVASHSHSAAHQLLEKAELVFCLDFNELARVDKMQSLLQNAAAPFVMIDHHTYPSEFAKIAFSYPEISSTCALLFCVIEQCGILDFMDIKAATCCCAGMMTDTGNFSYNSNSSLPYLILADLIKKGVDKDRLTKLLFDTTTLSSLRITGYCQSQRLNVYEHLHLAIITLSHEESLLYNYHKGDTEGLVNLPLGIPEVIWSVYLREMEPGKVKVSMRSKGDFSVREICATHFEGGGHHNAAGGEIHADIPQTVSRILEIAKTLAQKAEAEFENQKRLNSTF